MYLSASKTLCMHQLYVKNMKEGKIDQNEGITEEKIVHRGPKSLFMY